MSNLFEVEMKDLAGKVAVVTGGSQGLGLAIGMALGIDGARVLLVSRRAKELREAAKRVSDLGGTAETFTADITAPGAASDIVDAALSRYDQAERLGRGRFAGRGAVGPFEQVRLPELALIHGALVRFERLFCRDDAVGAAREQGAAQQQSAAEE